MNEGQRINELQACQNGDDYEVRAASVPELYTLQGFNVQVALAEGVTGTPVAAMAAAA